MALTHSLTSVSPSLFLHVPKLHSRKSPNPFHVLFCAPPKTTAAPSLSTEQEVLKAVVESDGKTLPCVRTYENDLARLSLVGAVDFDQALTAAAADGGQAANEHSISGLPAMVVETVFPGPTGDRATVSTRLFLPAKKVIEKSKKFGKSLMEDSLYGTTSRNILAMTFRQVVMQQLWNFELVFFRPGTERDMSDLENLREQVPASFTLASLDERVISMLAEVVCITSLQSTERNFCDNLFRKTSSNFFSWFWKPKKFASKDSSVIVYQLFEDEIVENAKSLLETFNSLKESVKPVKMRPKCHWWTPSTYTKLEKIGGLQFSAWTSEYVPAYRLEIDASRFKDAKFEGWRESAENRWEVLLTHSQMVGLADILDMYYEDIFSMPSKELSCGAVVNYTDWSSRKMEAFCVSVVKKIKDAFAWPGDIVIEMGIGAWIGEIPNYLKLTRGDDSNSTDSASLEKYDVDMKSSVQDIASYQVVLSTDGKIIGFQPTSRVAVNHWAANPLAKELYGGRKLSPGLIEPSLKIPLPNEVVLIELLMSVNRDSCFALARPIQL